VERVDNGILWMNIEGTIIHVASKTLVDAKKLLELSIQAGYKSSTLYSMSTRGITVEILLSDKYSIPVYTHEKGLIISRNELKSIIKYIENRFRDIENAKHKLINLLLEYKAYENTNRGAIHR